MKIFVDECVYSSTTKLLRNWGHNVETVYEAGLAGREDQDLLKCATKQNQILISIDMDFSNAVRFVPSLHSGIIILKIRPTTLDNVHQILKEFLEKHREDEIHQSLVIIDKAKYRIRK